jgi:predicted transcriptional regulator
MMMPEPVILRPDAKVQEAMHLMNAWRIGSVLVCDEGGGLVGIFTERDLLKRVVTAVPGWRENTISAWMTPNPHVIGPDVDWNDAVGTMQQMGVRHLPVIDGGRLIGILSPRGLMEKRTAYLDRQVEERTFALRQANDELLARDSEMTRMLRAAGRLQKQLLLPKAPPVSVGLTWAVHYAPLDDLGGDYYDFAEHSRRVHCRRGRPFRGRGHGGGHDPDRVRRGGPRKSIAGGRADGSEPAVTRLGRRPVRLGLLRRTRSHETNLPLRRCRAPLPDLD